MEDKVDTYGDVVARTMLNGGERIYQIYFMEKDWGDGCIKPYLRLCKKKDKIRPDIIIHD